MTSKSFKSLLVAGFSLVMIFFSNVSLAQGGEEKKETKKLDPAKIIMEHVSDGHEFHFATVGGHHVTIPLPVILYSPQKGLSVFMSSAFDHGKELHDGYRLLEEDFIEEHKLNEVKDAKGAAVFFAGKVYATDAAGMPDNSVKVYDFSLTRNVVQIFISLILLVWIMTGVAKQYAKGKGVTSAPSGFQNAVEPIITFVRDEVGKPNLGHKYEKYMPYLLTVFFFILINNLIGMIPGTANVTGNIAFTAMLGIISFIVILFSSNKHYWGHIINPPVPFAIKFIMVPIEIMGIFTKPFALIIRLFANMISGHIIILSFIILIFIFGAMNTALGWGTSPLFVLFSVFIYLLEVLVAFIQAFIFANLTAVFIGQAFEGGHDHDDVPGHEDAIVI
ncbi:MAG: F0F1 ATP synthase subunit A [Bacteroidetes bacterium]|nr:F0F1 ATP synthase subunit A [Bacteroidota bacterium]